MPGEKDGRDKDTARDAGQEDKEAAPCADERPPVRIAPVKPKVGEGEGNLQRREHWLRRRRR